MSGVSVTIQGDREIQAALKRAGVAIEDVVREAVAEIALVHVETAAKQFVPVDTGRLRSSIGTTFLDAGLNADVGTNVEYASYVESGTSRMAAQPYMTPAIESARSQAPSVVAKYVKRVTG